MLLLLTIGLVLVATVALVIGFVTSALAPIYVSIACSVAAALVLFFFSRLSKRDAKVPAAAGPAPLPGPVATAEASQPGSTVTVLGTAPASPAAEATVAADTTGEVPVVAPPTGEEAFAPEGLIATAEPAGGDGTAVAEAPASAWDERAVEAEAGAGALGGQVEAAPAEAFAAVAASGEGEEPGEAGQEDYVFPIADYDDLRVSEILPLLPELDEDELQMVREREQQGRARFSILTRLDQLTAQLRAATGVPSQGFEEDVAGVGVPSAPPAPLAAPPASPAGEWPAPPEAPLAPPPPPEVPPAEADMAVAAAGGEGQGVPAPEALDGGADLALGEPGQEPADVELEPAAETVLEPSASEAAAAEAVPRAFPIADYEGKKVTEILPLLANLGADDLALVAEHERAGKARGSVLSRIEQLRARAAEAAPPPTAAKRVVEGGAAKKAAARKAPAKKAAPGAGATKASAGAGKTEAVDKAAKTTKAAKVAKAGKAADKAPAKKASPRTTKKQ